MKNIPIINENNVDVLDKWLLTTLWALFDESSMYKLRINNSTAEFILQPFRHFTYVTAHSPTLPSLYLRHSSFSNPSVTSPTS